MSPKATAGKRSASERRKSGEGIARFLRSISLLHDAEAPERISHFRPTSKSVQVLRMLAAPEPCEPLLVAAPYGSGKSLMATYLLHLLENRQDSAEALETIRKRLQSIAPELSTALRSRARSKRRRRGLVLALHGFVPNLAAALKCALEASAMRLRLGRQLRPLRSAECESIDDAISLLDDARDKLCAGTSAAPGCDSITILWDEFGKHLETLLAEGRTRDLLELQQLAEYSVRTTGPSVRLALLLHKGLQSYARNASQAVQLEWRKVEGRFLSLQYVDDSVELYRLIAEVLKDVSSKEAKTPPNKAEVKTARKVGLFPGLSESELGSLLADAWPLTPAAFYLLPRLTARIAQNERTVFDLIHAMPLTETLGLAELYDAMTPAMRSDTGLGGTHRRWLEAESALQKCHDVEGGDLPLKAACLLGLGSQGERGRVSRDLLEFAIRPELNGARPASLVDRLVERKLLLHRRHDDEVAVWHGTDVDLRSRLDDELQRRGNAFDFVSFLRKEMPAPTWRPVAYNTDFGVRRYLEAEYAGLGALKRDLQGHLEASKYEIGTDGRILHILPEDAEELEAALRDLEGTDPPGAEDARLLLTLPAEPLPLKDAAAEVHGIQQLMGDAELIGSDPLILPELEQMLDDARGHLQQLLDRSTQPSQLGARWYHRGHQLADVDSPAALQGELSRIMREVFSKTPALHNEMIVRKRPAAVVVNSRKKLNMGILECTGQEDLSIEGNFPDMSMFRTLLLNTGLYRQTKKGAWRWAKPKELDDEALAEVWGEFQSFFSKPSHKPRSFKELFNTLLEPPYGLRLGVVPIFVAAAMRAFPRPSLISHKGTYLSDVLATEIESIVKQADEHSILVLHLTDGELGALEKLTSSLLGGEEPVYEHEDVVRQFHDALRAWVDSLPRHALVSRDVSDDGKKLQSMLRGRVDVIRLIREDLPREFGVAKKRGFDLDAVERGLSEIRDGVRQKRMHRAADAVCRALGVSRSGSRANFEDCLLARLPAEWAMSLDEEARQFLRRVQEHPTTVEELVRRVAMDLVGLSVDDWDDHRAAQFQQRVSAVANRITEKAVYSTTCSPDDPQARRHLRSLIEERLQDLNRRLSEFGGSASQNTSA